MVGVSGEQVAVVGGGVIGLSVAWRLAGRGGRVVLVDPAPASGASWVAGGMLAPVTETWPGEEAGLALGMAAVRRWPAFAEELGGGLVSEAGTLVVAVDGADRGRLDLLAAHLRALGRHAEPLTAREVRAAEPGVSPSVRSGLSVPGDLAVDNRRLLAALLAACRCRGVRFLREQAVSVAPGAVELEESTVECEVAVLAAGAWSARLHPKLAGVVRPVKGEILRLRARRGSLPPPRHTVRALVESRPLYLVPRPGGDLVVGATEYEAGYDTEVTVSGVADLLADARRVWPSLGDYALVESAAGLRAGSVDNRPVVDWLEPGVLAATGHHRNGLLLAPVTADRVLDLLDRR